ncbi:MAG: radical SAM protein [Clostridia bacterium]|nr:radical SAM protein [Clostridia bacterium]
MRISARERRYAEQNFNEVHHTTLNPEGPGVVRIHLIPPVLRGGRTELASSVVILNGQDIIPLNLSWSILLMEFIREVNRFSGRAVTDEDLEVIRKNTCRSVRKVYPFILPRRLNGDVYYIMDTFKRVAYGEPVDAKLGSMDLGAYAPYMRGPHRMDLMVSAMTVGGKWHCNQRCVHCYAAGQPEASESELSTGDWKRIIDRCREACIPQLTFTGGEPTMRGDLIELIDYAKWFITRLNTNGIKLTKEYCEKLRAASLDSMQITFYSHDEAVHNELVGAEGWRMTLDGIKNAIDAGINVSVNTPLCTLNRDYAETLRFLRGLGVTYVTCSGLITTGNAALTSSERLQLTREEISAILRESAAYCWENGMELSFTSPGWVDEALCGELGIRTPSCGACLSNMAITPGGNVVPCQSWLSGPVLGNMLNDRWEDIWNSPACRERRGYSAQMRCECPLRKKPAVLNENTAKGEPLPRGGEVS